MRSTGTPLPSWLQRLVGWSPVRGRASRAESNRPVVNPNLHDWCFRLDRHAPSLMQADRRRWIERSMHQTCSLNRINGTAYPDSIASILRDAFGGERRSYFV